jgi:hypothetical protein
LAIFAFNFRASATKALSALAPDFLPPAPDFRLERRFAPLVALDLREALRLEPVRALEPEREPPFLGEPEPLRVFEREPARRAELDLRDERRLEEPREEVDFLVAMVAPWSRAQADGSAVGRFYRR